MHRLDQLPTLIKAAKKKWGLKYVDFGRCAFCDEVANYLIKNNLRGVKHCSVCLVDPDLCNHSGYEGVIAESEFGNMVMKQKINAGLDEMLRDYMGAGK